MIPDLAIRPAAHQDLDALADIHLRSWNLSARGLLPEPVISQRTFEYRRAYWERHFSQHQAPFSPLVAEARGRILGLAGLAGYEAQRTLGEVKHLYVDPDFIGRGVGTLLLTTACARLRAAGCDAARLWVLEGNRDGCAFYERLGWTPTGGRLFEGIDQTDEQLPLVEYALRL